MMPTDIFKTSTSPAPSILAVINPASGSVPANAQEMLRQELDDIYAESVNASIVSDLDRAFDSLNSHTYDLVITWSGDGTIASILNKIGNSTPLLPLPGGTMNMLHEQWHGEYEDWRDCLHKCLHGGNIVDVTAGLANDTPFYVGAILGDLADITESREAIREGDAIKAFELFMGSTALDLNHDIELKLSKQYSAQENILAIGALLNTTTDSPQLDVGALEAQNLLELSKVAFGSLVQDWRQNEQITFYQTKHCHIDRTRTDTDVIPATLDGELMELTLPVKLTLKPNAARIVCCS